MSEIERQRDAALIGYNECRATIEDARRALGAPAHEGLLLAAMRVTEQRDRLAEAIRKHRDELKLTSGDSVDRILWNTLEAVEGGSDD